MADRWIERFRRDALPKLLEEFKPDKIIIFGSRVRGTARKDSDIDVIVISSYFANIPFLKRMPSYSRKSHFKNMWTTSVIPKENMRRLRMNPQ